MKHVRVAMVLAAAWSVAVAGLAKPEAEWSARLEKCTFTLSEAIDRALGHAGVGFAFHVELEQDGAHLVYSVDVAQGDQNCNVVMDVTNGKVIEKDTEDEDHSAEIAACQITLAGAIKKALKAVPGEAVEAELRMRGGKSTIEVKVFADGKVLPVAVDGESGKVISGDTAEGGKKAEPRKKAEPAAGESFTDTFAVDAEDWSSTGVNPWFNLTPGYVLVLEGEDEGETVRLTITVLDETKEVDGVETRVVEEREQIGDEIQEISLNYFAISRKTNCVYYFGEDSADYEDGEVKDHHGSWLAGVDGARFGLLIPGTPLLGARYYQEIAPGVAMDRAEVVSLDGKMETPAGTFENVLKTEETTPLEKGREYKYYAAGVGLLKDGNLKLIRYGKSKKSGKSR